MDHPVPFFIFKFPNCHVISGGVSCRRPPEAAVVREETAARGAQEVRLRVAEAGRRSVCLRTSIQGVPGHPGGLEAVAGHEEVEGGTEGVTNYLKVFKG